MRFQTVAVGQRARAPSAHFHNTLVQIANAWIAGGRFAAKQPKQSKQSTAKDRTLIRVKLTQDVTRGDPVAYGAAIRSSVDDFDQYTTFGPTFEQVNLSHLVGHKFGFAHRGGLEGEVIPVVIGGIAIANVYVRNTTDQWAYPFQADGEDPPPGDVYTGTGGFCQLLDEPASTGAQTIAVHMGLHQPLWRFESVSATKAQLWHFDDTKDANLFETPDGKYLNQDTIFDDLDADYRGLLMWLHPWFVPIQATCGTVT